MWHGGRTRSPHIPCPGFRRVRTGGQRNPGLCAGACAVGPVLPRLPRVDASHCPQYTKDSSGR